MQRYQDPNAVMIIDGAYLRKSLDSKGKIDIPLINKFLEDCFILGKSDDKLIFKGMKFWFDTWTEKNKGVRNLLQSLGFSTPETSVKKVETSCPKCTSKHTIYKQTDVDQQISFHIMNYVINKDDIKNILIVTGDKDFFLFLRKVKDIDKRVFLITCQETVAASLLSLANHAIYLDKEDVLRSILLDKKRNTELTETKQQSSRYASLVESDQERCSHRWRCKHGENCRHFHTKQEISYFQKFTNPLRRAQKTKLYPCNRGNLCPGPESCTYGHSAPDIFCTKCQKWMDECKCPNSYFPLLQSANEEENKELPANISKAEVIENYINESEPFEMDLEIGQIIYIDLDSDTDGWYAGWSDDPNNRKWVNSAKITFV